MLGNKKKREPGRLSFGRCPRCKITGARLLASLVLEAEVCARCLVAGAAGEGWLRDSDVQLLPGSDGGRSAS